MVWIEKIKARWKTYLDNRRIAKMRKKLKDTDPFIYK
jgi:hypothetical protein